MSTFDIRTDSPDLLRAEALTMTLSFERTGDTTGRITWNIPQPAAGCEAGSQAYCGIVLTLATEAIRPYVPKPENGRIYQFDPTADTNLFSGDKIGDALVVGAFYNDRETTSIDIDGLEPHGSYFFSGYPVDCQNRYYTDGIFSYSVDHTNAQSTPGTTGSQTIALNVSIKPQGVDCDDQTGLDATKKYSFKIQLGVEPRLNRPLRQDECRKYAPIYDVEIDGADAQTYCELIDQINIKLAQLDVDNILPQPPETGKYVVAGNPVLVWRWTGHVYELVPFINRPTDPTVVLDGQFWFDPEAETLYEREAGVWTPRVYHEYVRDPSKPVCDRSVWIKTVSGDPVEAYRWNGTTWCQIPLYVATESPLKNNVGCGTYWYDTEENFLFRLNHNTFEWENVDAIQSYDDPYTVADGYYWFDETSNKLKVRNQGAWITVNSASIAKNPPASPIDGKLWVNTTDYVLNQYDSANAEWVEVLTWIPFPTDPTNQTSCGLWWNLTDEKLYVYSTEDAQWVEVTQLFKRSRDPLLDNEIEQGAIWYNPDLDQYLQLDNDCFVEIDDLIVSPTNPAIVPIGTIWRVLPADVFRRYDGSAWVDLDVLFSQNDPTTLPLGTMWWNGSSLYSWNGLAWIQVGFSTKKTLPAEGTKWYDTTTNELYEWKDGRWVVAVPLAEVALDCNNYLTFTHTGVVGSLSMVRIKDIDLFSSLDVKGLNILDPSPGGDGYSDIPMYDQEGVGTDGSTDERNLLSTQIRYYFGYPQQTVELTVDQIDLAITMALAALRERASSAYRRGFFFLETQGEVQVYRLTNKTQGMEKIVQVLAVTRMTSAFLSSAHGAGVYGQIMLQHLYNMGNFDILSYHLMTSYVKELEMMFAARITFNWNEFTHELFIHQRLPFRERVVMIEAMVERTEQEIMSDRRTKEWIRRYATAKCKEMLANIRGKFSTLPGASGNVTLNAAELRTQSEQELLQCMEDLEQFVNDLPEELGYTSAFVYG